MTRLELLLGWGMLTIVMYLMVWNRESLYLLAVASLLLTILLVGFLIPWLAVTSTRLTLKLAESSSNDAPEFLDISARNYFPWPHDGLIINISLSAKGSVHVRNFPLALPRIYPGMRELRISLPPMPRGRYRFSQATVSTTQPFGFWRFERPIASSDAAIVVRPKRFGMSARQWLEGTAMHFSGHSPQGRAGHSSEFFGVREYRPGDSPRHIDWKATARLGELIVREFDDVTQPELLVVVDNHNNLGLTDAGLARFEESIRLAATAAESALLEGMSVGLQSQSYTLPNARGDIQGWQLLEAFTDIQPDASTPLHEKLTPLLSEPTIKTLLVITSPATTQWLSLRTCLQQLAAHGHQLTVVLTPEQADDPEAAAKTLRPYFRRVETMGTRPVETLLS